MESDFDMAYCRTVPLVDLRKFLGTWYVVAGRTTPLERGAHNSIESYRWNAKKKRIDVRFTFRKNSFEGKPRLIKQKAWVEDPSTQAHWKVQAFWPLKFDYLILALAPDYSWTAIGTSNQKYLWVMSQVPEMSTLQLESILAEVERMGYSTREVERIPQKHEIADRIRNHTLDQAS